MSISNAEKQRRYRKRKRALASLDPIYDFYRKKGRVLEIAFIKAWAEVSRSDAWYSKYKVSHFEDYNLTDKKDSSQPDFTIIAEDRIGNLFRLAVFELKNWEVPQYLDLERTKQKITKKFYASLDANWLKLLILTPAVHFQSDAWNYLAANRFLIEVVDHLPRSHPDGAATYPLGSIEQSRFRDYEARSIQQMKRILEKYFLD